MTKKADNKKVTRSTQMKHKGYIDTILHPKTIKPKMDIRGNRIWVETPEMLSLYIIADTAIDAVDLYHSLANAHAVIKGLQ